uniref:Variant surface glycoprotein 1125.181 n=1 Tax=Trypanosoma brucei TaxID=5691 RepID=A0A1J0R5E5_9TRYP|nr:variant surface glycoprotein 1125.181 [Trypanosoma brucei]
MGKAALAILSLISVYVNLRQTTAAIPTGANRQEHAVLCKFLAIAEGSLDLTQPTALNTGDYELLQALNLSTSSAAWQSMIYKDKSQKTLHADPNAAGKGNIGYEEYWSDWKKAALDVLEDGGRAEVKALKIGQLTPDQRTAANQLIRKFAKKARDIKTSFPPISEAAQARNAAEAKTALKMAVYGADVINREAATSNNAFGADTKTTPRATVCEAQNLNQRAKTVLTTLTCLCEKAAATEVTDGACTKEAEGGTGWNAAANKAPDADLVKIVKTCPQPRKKPYTFDDINTAIADLRALIHTSGSDGYLGAKIGASCDGKNTGRVCIKISGYEAAGAGGLDKITWVSAFSTLAGHMQERAAQVAAGERNNKILGELANEAKHEIESAKAIQWSRIRSTTQSTTTPDKTTAESKACHQYDTNKTCVQNNCKWEAKDGKSETEGECKPKGGEGQTNAGTGEGAAGTTNSETKKCSDKTKQEECKDGCNWDGKECKDSSFLLSKQFALSVVSAFVALLL